MEKFRSLELRLSQKEDLWKERWAQISCLTPATWLLLLILYRLCPGPAWMGSHREGPVADWRERSKNQKSKKIFLLFCYNFHQTEDLISVCLSQLTGGSAQLGIISVAVEKTMIWFSPSVSE